jgi:glutamine amidotransferase
MRIGVLDYGVGNLGSVVRALEELRVIPVLINRAIDMHSADCFILPGVGSFTECKRTLDADGWTQALNDEVLGYEKPILGICLGMQLLAEIGMEGAADAEGTPGLGFIAGTVRSLSSIGCASRVPHMGWNSITVTSKSSLLNGINDGTDFYFVHSYAFVPDNTKNILATTEYDISVTAVVGSGHVWGTQFHPEKSSKAGFKVLRNFIEGSEC